MSSSSSSSSSISAPSPPPSSTAGQTGLDAALATLAQFRLQAEKASLSPDGMRNLVDTCGKQLDRLSPDKDASPSYEIRVNDHSAYKYKSVVATRDILNGAVIARIPASSAHAMLPFDHMPCLASSEIQRRLKAKEPKVVEMDKLAKRRRSILSHEVVTWESSKLKISDSMLKVALQDPQSDIESERKRMRFAHTDKLYEQEQETRLVFCSFSDYAIIWLALACLRSRRTPLLKLVAEYVVEHSAWQERFAERAKTELFAQLDQASAQEFIQNTRKFYSLIENSFDARRRYEWTDALNNHGEELYMFSEIFRKSTLRMSVPGLGHSNLNELMVVHPLTAAIDHSCCANAHLVLCDSFIYLIASRAIKAEDKIELDYLQLSPATNMAIPSLYFSVGYDQRAVALRRGPGIINCHCQLCLYDKQYKQYSPVSLVESGMDRRTIFGISHEREDLLTTVKESRLLNIHDLTSFASEFPSLCVSSNDDSPALFDYGFAKTGEWARAFSAYNLSKPDVFDETNFIHVTIVSVIAYHTMISPAYQSDLKIQAVMSALQAAALSHFNKLMSHATQPFERRPKATERSKAWTWRRFNAVARASAAFSAALMPAAMDYWYAAYFGTLKAIATDPKTKDDEDTKKKVATFVRQSRRENELLLLACLQSTPCHIMVDGLTLYAFVTTLASSDFFESFMRVCTNYSEN